MGLPQKIDSKELSLPQSEMWRENVKNYLKEKNLEDSIYSDFYLVKNKEKEIPSAENTGLIHVRALLGDVNEKKSSVNKYVLLQSYYNQGDLSTIDLVKLPKKMHQEIAEEYLTKILKPELSHEFLPHKSKNLSKNLSRFLIGGGYAKIKNDSISFEGSSGDFGNHYSPHSVNDISAYLIDQAGLYNKIKSTNKEKGREYIERVLDTMANYKHKKEFYSKLVDLYVKENVREDISVHPHILASLAMMKAYDRAKNKGISLLQAIIEETTDGIGREIMMAGLAERLKKEER